jgi:cell division protein FtsW
MAVFRKFKQPDYALLGVIGLLLAAGLLILASVSAPFSYQKFDNTYYFLKHQITHGLLPGLILGFLAFKINLSLIKKWSPLFLLGNLILMALVFVPHIGLEIDGASRWISLGPISLQPSETLKVAFFLYLAAWLANRTPGEKTPKEKKLNQTFLVFSAIVGFIAVALISQPDVSTFGLICFVALIMYFANNTPIWHSLSMIALGFGALAFLVKLAPYRMNRVTVFFNPEADPMGIGYQLKQSLIAIGSGGATGAGFGLGVQKLGLLPQPIADSIFAVFSEETGFVGSLFLLSLFLLFLWRGFKIAKEAENRFEQLLALGITSWITLQAFINIGAMMGLFPLTGIPLPFVSYGGTALITVLVGAGLLLNISQKT